MMKSPLSTTFLSYLLLAILAGCSGGGGGKNATNISGVVMMPAQQVASSRPPALAVRLGNLFIASASADVLGLVPVANTTVELVRLDSQGNVTAVIASTTSDGAGNYTFATTLAPSSDLAVRLPGEPTLTRAIVTQASTDITPATESVVRSIVDEIIASGTVLGNYSTQEVAALVDLVNGMDIDVSTAPTFEDAVLTVRAQAGAILSDMTAGYGAPGSVSALFQNNYALTGETTTLVPPPQLNGASAGIDHRAVDGALGFERSTQRVKGGTEFSLLVLNDLSAASYFCDSDSVVGDAFVPASTGQVTITPAQGGGAVVGALSADNSLLIYPMTNTRAGIDGNSSGIGRGLRIGFLAKNLPPSQALNANPQVSGNYNMVWTANYMGGGGGGMMGGGGSSFSSATGSITLFFDSSTTNGDPLNPQSPLSSSNGTVTTLTVDLGSYAVTSSSGADTISGVYQVLPGSDVLAPLGDTAGMMGGGMGSGDFLQGMRLQVPEGQVSSLLAFSSWIAGGGMGGGGNMGMGNAQCGSTGGGMMGGGSGMMGGAAGEGRGVALAALQEVNITQAKIIGTYNAVAMITTFTEGTGTAFVDSEVNYGSFNFDGAGNVTSGNLYFQRATMDVAAASGGNGSAVTTATGSNSYTGTYSVNAVDGTLSMSLTGLGTGNGFAARGGELLVLPIQETTATTGKRGLLILMRRP